MNLEMKSIKYAAFASQETNCFEAVIWKDGQPWAHVSNEGHGGPDRFEPIYPEAQPNFYDDVKVVNDALASSPEGIRYTARCKKDYKMNLTFDLEAWCGERLEDHLQKQKLKRTLRNKVVFIDKGKLFQIGYNNKRKVDTLLVEHVRQKYPEAVVLNTMKPDMAFEAWQTVAD